MQGMELPLVAFGWVPIFWGWLRALFEQADLVSKSTYQLLQVFCLGEK